MSSFIVPPNSGGLESSSSDATFLDAMKVQTVAIKKLTQSVSLSILQAAGGVLTATFNVGSSLPADAKVLGAEIVVSQVLAGIGLSAAIGTVQGSTDLAGTLITGVSLLSIGTVGGNGVNQYLSRGGQQITLTITLTGIFFSALTAGTLTVNVFYTVLS